MAAAERVNTNCECFLEVVPSVQNEKGECVGFSIDTTINVYRIIKRDWEHFKVQLQNVLEYEFKVKVINFELSHENDLHMLFICRFATIHEQTRFQTCVDEGKVTIILTKYAENNGFAVEMGFDPTTNFKVQLSVNNSITQKGIQVERESSRMFSNQTPKRENMEVLQMSEIAIPNQDKTRTEHTHTEENPRKLGNLVRLYVHTEPKNVTNVLLHYNNKVAHMNRLARTKLWETYVSPSEKRFEFSIEERVRQSSLSSMPEDRQKHKPILFSAYSSLNHIFLLMPKADSYGMLFWDAVFENLRYIINTISKENPKEAMLQLESVMKESGLPAYVGLHLQQPYWRFEDIKWILRELTVDDNNAVFYCYLIHLIVADLNVLCKDKLVDVKSAHIILKACTNISRKDIPKGCLQTVANVIQYVYRMLYKDEASLLHLLSLTYKFFGDVIFLEILQNNFTEGKRVLGIYEPTSKFDCLELLELLYNIAEASNRTTQLVKLIFRHLPISQHIEFMEKNKKYDLHEDLSSAIKLSLSNKIVIKMISSGKKGDLNEVLTLWKKSRALCPHGPKSILDFTQNAIVAALEVEEKMILYKGVNHLFDVLKEDILFQNSVLQFKLLKLLSRSKNNDLQQLFFDLLNNKKHMTLDEDKMCRIISTCFSNILQHFKTKESSEKERVFKYYYHYNRIIGTLYVTKHCTIQQKLEDIILGLLQKCKFRTMILAIPDIEAAQDLADIYQKHINKILLECYTLDSEFLNKIVFDICGSSTLTVDTRTILNVIQTILDAVKISDDDSDETVFGKITDSSKFWICILTSKGKLVDVINQHSKVKKVEKTIQNTMHDINKQCINSRFLLLLKTRKEESNNLLYCMTHETGKSKDKLSECIQKLSDYQLNLRLVESTFRKLRGFPNKTVQSLLRKSIEYVKGIEDDLEHGRVIAHELSTEISDIQIVQDIAELCKRLENVVVTRVFLNVTRQCLENKEAELEQIENSTEYDVCDKLSVSFLFDEPNLGHHGERPFSLRSSLKVVEILANDCLRRYKQLWFDFEQETDYTVADMATIFNGVDDMVGEIKKAENACLFTMKENKRNSLIQFSKIPSYRQTIDTIKIAAKAFKFDNQDSIYFDTTHKFESLLSENFSGVTLQDIIPVLQQIDTVDRILSEDIKNILQALKKSSALLEFLQEVVDDDLRNLIDAVEEHSEQYVRESTVSDLIEIKRFLHPILKGNFVEKIGELFELLQKQIDNIGNNHIPEKIFICGDNLHSLKALYRNVANRGERTVEVIENIMQKGAFHFSLESRSCEVVVEYKQERKKHKHSSADLSDLRSRALLLMNAENKDKIKPKSIHKGHLEKFVHLVDEALEISALCLQLKQAGHFSFARYEEICRRKNMKELKLHLQHQYEEWKSEIQACRMKYYYLNFLYADQLYQLYYFLREDKRNDIVVTAILRFIDPSMGDLEHMTDIYNSLPTSANSENISVLENIGRTLDQLYSGLHTTSTLNFLACRGHTKITDKVQPGIPYITSLAKGSPLVIRTLLALYLNTTGIFPQANKVLFCRRDTTFEEISLLLNRCLQEKCPESSTRSLYSIANIEMLQPHIQFDLHNEIRRLPKGDGFLLCLICRGHENHPFLDQFSDMLSRPSPLSELVLKQFMGEHWSHVTVVTSDVPGLGKSEFIQRTAIRMKKRSVCVHISGPFNRLSIIENIIRLRPKKYHVLHLDIGAVSDPAELDLFVFEMIVLRHISAGSTAYALSYGNIFIEIANTINDELSNSLPTITCFQREHLQWMGYENLRVSSEINSPIQVVCHYLKSLDEGLVDIRDLYFTGIEALEPLENTECGKILERHFQSSGDMSFTIMNVFINVLADQLKKLSASVFFRTPNLMSMLKENESPTVKSSLIKALEHVSKDFASRSVNACRSAQAESFIGKFPDTSAEILSERTSGMIRWEDSNHLVVLFHQNVQTVSALYRKVQDVPQSVKNLFESQVKNKLVDFKDKSNEELKTQLLMLTRKSSIPMNTTSLLDIKTNYVLTPDNLLKMVLISLRVNSKVPVLIMGETGCGKTSLIAFLAKICGVNFDLFSIHAGIEDSDITKKFNQVNQKALQNISDQFWLFLDEINTCNHLGLIADSLCHRMLFGKDLAPNLTLLAACNPYRLREEKEILTTGLQGKINQDELSRLVYRVHPLPESLIDYVWDYGSLSEDDEVLYILKMVDDVFSETILTRLLADILVKSQRFVRTVENNDYCVSLRDVDRCRRLVKWFDTFLLKKNHINSIRDRQIRAIILGLAICYHSRFPEGEKRQKYRHEVQKCICSTLSYKITEDEILDHILIEQKYILNLMTELPPGTALNAALQENVFMLLVCILNKIPIFLVGKPGCSKSLSMQLIRSNLRGKDSSSHLFQDMPQLFCVSFQGSESSTSDGIIKVFEKAEKYQMHNDDRDVLSVVILDEIGLAEISKFNPLKVLHGLIERHDEQMKVAVVGISNWALDAAKMNRAIHLSRPDMDLKDLIYTGKSISESMIPSQEIVAFSLDTKHTSVQQTVHTELLEGIAKAYNEYYLHELKFPNFHGLRDFYSLIKYLGRNIDVCENTDDYEVCEVILTGIFRNFGGLPTEKNKILKIFRKYIPGITSKEIPVIKLIVENIRDNSCRHLMLITNGDAVISILENQLNELGMPFDIIFGSRFEDDLTDAYNYRILSRIILCMEQGMVLILKDLESIYGSLYDMLNQNYTVVGKKKHCRVALGHYSNPMCQVHDNFKCVVLVEESKLDYSDPPFLNRFEKQQVTFSDFLDKESLKKAVDELDEEMNHFCKIPNHSFSPCDVIPSYSQNLLISLIIRSQHLTKCTASIETVKKLAFDTLLWLIPPEVIIRSTESVFSNSKTSTEINHIINKYMQLPIHTGLCHYFDSLHMPSTDRVEQIAETKEILKKANDSKHVEIIDAVGVEYLDIAQCIDTQKSDNTIREDSELTGDVTSIEMDDLTDSFKEQTLQEVWEENPNLNLFADIELASGYDSDEQKAKSDSCAWLNVVYTFSGINAIIDTSGKLRKLQRDKLAIFKSEKQFSLTVEEFFQSDNDIYLLHCISSTESQHLLLVKGIIEKHIRTHKIDLCQQGKCICIVVHLERNGNYDVPLTFLSGWRLLFIDSIRKPGTLLEQFLSVDKVQIVSERKPLDNYIKNMILWAFSRIQFTSKHVSVQTIEDLMTRMKSSSDVITTIEAYILSWTKKTSLDIDVFEPGGYELQIFGSSSWCLDVAKNPYELLKAGSFIDALEHGIQEIIRHPLTLFIFKLVEQNLLNPIFVEDSSTPARKLVWKQIVLSENYVTTDDMPPPSGPECYLCSSEPLHFYMPCSQILMMQIDSRKNEYLEIIGRFRIDNSIDPDEEMPKDLFENATTSCIDFICYEAINILEEEFTYTDRNKDLIRDFCNFHSFAILSETNELHRINIFKWALSNFIHLSKLEHADFLVLVSNLHAGLWVYGHVINAICEMVNLLIRSIDISILPIPAMNLFKEFGHEASCFVTQNKEIICDDEHLSFSEMKDHEHARLNSVSTHDVESSDMLEIKTFVDHMGTYVTSKEPVGTDSNSYTGTDNSPSRNNENDKIVCHRDTKMQPRCDMVQYEKSYMSREQLVKHVCLSLLPTREVLKDLDINEWLCLIRNVLPLAHIVHDDSCELTALKFCQDLADFRIENENIPVTDINNLGQCILECNGNLDSTNVCECLYRILRKLKSETPLEARKLQKLFCSYILRCLISAQDNTEPLKFVLSKITRNEFFDQTLSYFGQVVKFAVMIDLNENMDIYMNMLKDMESFENEANFCVCFDFYLTNLEITNTINMSLPILLLDALEHYAFDEHLTIEHMKSIDSSSDEIIQCLSQSFHILESGVFSLKFIVALAFLRKFMALFVDLLESTKYDCCTYPILSQYINSAMEVTTKNDYGELLSSEILHLLMKHIDKRLGHQHIQLKCKMVESYIPVFKKVQWETRYVEKSSVFNPLFLHIDKECFNLFLTHVKNVGHKNNKLNDLLLASDGMWNFVCVLAQSCFMSKCLRERNDREMHVAEQISNLVQKLQITGELKNIINKILGIKNFKHNLFNLSVMVESPQPQIISVMIHLACIVGNLASHDNFWYQLIMKPLSIASCNVPYTRFKNVQENELPGKFSVFPNVSGNILQLFLHSSLVLSLELETTSLEAVKNSVGFDYGDVNDYLEMQLRQNWQSLENILQLTSNDLCILLHTILFKSLSMFTVEHHFADVKAAYDMLMAEHECIIHPIIMNRYTIIHKSKQHSASLYDKSETSIENCVLEITPCQSSSNMNFVTQLFRVYKKPSRLIMFADLLTTTKQEFPLLRLVIENLDKLCLPQKMLSILKWHLTLVTYVSNKYRKVDFKDVTVSKLITDEHDDKKRKVLKLSFESFKNDWNEIRSRHWQLLNTEDTNLLESMQSTTKMNYAAIYGEKSQLQIVLNGLAKIQNNFLCLAHSLKSIKETPKTVPLLDIRSKDLLIFEWNDRLLQFSQCDSRYGLSQKIDFDYEKIEQEIQAEVLFGKCFIDVQLLPKITFTDDLFRNTVELLKEPQSNMYQYPLSSNIKKEVLQKSERDASQISDLLTHTGIILSLVRKTGALSEQPISEYLQKWETLLGISSIALKYPFPEDIKVGHIIPFYQWLEELNGENLANLLGDTYRIQLPREGRDCLLTKSNMKSIEKLSHAVKVFVHRCLSSNDNVIRPDQSLIDYLCDEHFWWKGDFENGYVLCEHLRISLKELLSPAIQVEHICETLQCIKESLEDSKQNDARVAGISIGYQTAGLNELSKGTRSKPKKKFMKT